MSKIKQAIGITLFESDGYGGPKIVCGGICLTQRANKLCCGVIEVMEMETERLGGLFDGDTKHQAGSVWDKEKLSPTIDTMQGGCREPMIIDDTYANRKPRTYEEYSPALRSGRDGFKTIVAMRGRNPDNPSDRTVGAPTEQILEPNSQGLCNTLTSVQKDNLVMEVMQLGFMDNGTGQHQSNTVYDENALCPNITTIDGGGDTTD